MTETHKSNTFVTEGRITLARNYASELAAKEPWATAPSCAEKAVRTIFGRWLLDPTAAIRPQYVPLFFQLVNKVESQMGVHRRASRPALPSAPAVMQSLTMPVDDVGPVAMATAVAI